MCLTVVPTAGLGNTPGVCSCVSLVSPGLSSIGVTVEAESRCASCDVQQGALQGARHTTSAAPASQPSPWQKNVKNITHNAGSARPTSSAGHKVEQVCPLSGSVVDPGSWVLSQTWADAHGCCSTGHCSCCTLRPGDMMGPYESPPIPAALVSQHAFSQRCLPTTSACHTGLFLTSTPSSSLGSSLFYFSEQKRGRWHASVHVWLLRIIPFCISLYVIHGARGSQSNPELANMASFARQLALKSVVSALCGLELQVDGCAHTAFIRGLG